jgi:hypothetical protein
MRVKEIWFRGAEGDEQREKIKQDLALAQRALDRLAKLIQQKRRNTTSFTDYNVENWSHLQADTNGYNRALDEILETIKIK